MLDGYKYKEWRSKLNGCRIHLLNLHFVQFLSGLLLGLEVCVILHGSTESQVASKVAAGFHRSYSAIVGLSKATPCQSLPCLNIPHGVALGAPY